MKKSSFVTLILGVISCLFFAMGMCMAMIPEWNAFRPGVIVGYVGIVFALLTVFVWRKMEHKQPIKISGKSVLTAIVGIAGALALGVGMCLFDNGMGKYDLRYCCRYGRYHHTALSDSIM